MVTIYFGGGEDSELFQVGGALVATTANTFRSTYARCSLEAVTSSSPKADYWQNNLGFAGSPTSFWFSARLAAPTSAAAASAQLLNFVDGSNYPRLRLLFTTTTFPSTLTVQKVNTAGTGTTLANTLIAWGFNPSGTNIPDKLDIQFVNAVSGSVDIYYNLQHVFSYTGDTTTETTTIAGVQLSMSGGGVGCYWSEIVVGDTDTRSYNLQTLAPVANGNTHNFDTGSPAASNVNEITLSDATLDGSTTNGQIDQYTIPAIAAGTYSIVSIGVSARMQKGATGPSKMDLGVRSSGTDYWSSDQTLTVAWATYQNWWATDPAGGGWSGLPTNIGLKSVT